MKSALGILIKRNTKMFFKDKGLFFTSLITPLILLVLYGTFLSNVYKDSFLMGIPEGFDVSEKIIDGVVSGQLFSSLMAVSCITVAFCSNMLMVQDKVTGNVMDLKVSPVKSSVLAIGYYVSTLISTFVVSFVAVGACLVYVYMTGWYMSASDVALVCLDVFILVMFGTVLSSIINMYLSSQGQISAVGSIVSSCYGFICGAYMPISQFSEGLQKVLSFLPGTYGTSLLRNHCMQGALSELEESGVPGEVIEGLKDVVDCNVYFFDEKVSISSMYLYLGITVVVLMAVYILLNALRRK
ncbi:MAG: ABC transporter permease [Ruminococcaceae bacterium]|nr:ABC transporter permease [Oscillospiraceae bacterium]